MAQGPKKPRKQRNTEYPALFTAARTPLARHEECCVFGCRNSDREPGTSFRDFPAEPDRWREWLQLINRSDLEHKLASRRCSERVRVCAAHFAPDSPLTPTLMLPTRRRVEYMGPGPLEMAMEIDLEPVVKTETEEEEAIIQIQFESEEPPTEPPNHLATLAGMLSQPQKQMTPPVKKKTRPKKKATLEIDSRISQNPPIKLEATPYFGFQANAAAQTDSIEPFYQRATFSVLEKIDIPPTIIHRYADILNRSVEVQTPPKLLDYFTVGLRRKLGKELEEAQRKLEAVENVPMEKNKFVKNCDKYLNEKIGNFVKSHAYLTNKFVDNKYPPEFKHFALNLYLLNPQCYKFVEQFFELPSKNRIQRFHLPARSGIHRELMASLMVKAEQMSVMGKMCAVSFNVMRLTRNSYYDVTSDYLCGMQEIDEVFGPEPAEYAALIMVRGLYNRWKQPVSFALLSEKRQYPELKAWVLKIIATLFDIGLLVKAFVTNLDDEFLDFPVEESTPYFEVSGRNIYQVYDVPYLYKCVRDALKQNEIHVNNTVAKWEDVLSVYNLDKEQEYRLMPNITEEHFNAKSSEDVKMATQVISKSVAAALHFHVAAKLVQKRAKETVAFLDRMSDLYEILFSRTLQKAYRATSAQQRFLKDTIEWLRTMQVKDIDGNVMDSKFISALIVTTKSVMLLKAHLKKCNVHYLLTKNLSQDCIRAYFKEVECSAKSERPTPIMFVRAFRRLCLVNLLSNTKKGAEEDDVMKTLVKISEYVKVDLERKGVVQRNSLAVGVTDYKVNWPSEEYIAGYLLWKCLERHSCKTLVNNLYEYYNYEDQSDADLLLHTFQCYNGDNTNRKFLTKPPITLVDFVCHMERKYNEASTNYKYNANFGRNIYLCMESDTFDMPCECFPIKFLKMLYIRLKIYDSVKVYNRRIKGIRRKGR